MNEPGRTALADQTDVGSYFVATYPPFSVWTREAVETGAGLGARGGGARRAAGAGARGGSAGAARAVPAHPVLPEALPLLLLPRLHGEERRGGQHLPRSDRARVGDLRPAPRPRRPRPRLRLLRRRHAVVPLDPAARRPRVAPQGGDAVGPRRGGDLRMRAGGAEG